MNIKPTTPHPTDPQQLESNRASEARKPDPATPNAREPERTAIPADSVKVSPEAKALAEGSESRAGESGLSAERLKHISARLASGYYDQPEVIDEVTRRVARDAGLQGKE